MASSSTSTPEQAQALANLRRMRAERENEFAESDRILADLIAQGKDKNLTDGYMAYVDNIAKTAIRHGIDPENYRPTPYNEFKHDTCVLCAETIADDPYGHNPAPFRDDYPTGHCCSACNSKFVIPMRMKLMTAKTGEKAKVKKMMKGLDDFFISRVPAPSREEVLQDATNVAVAKHIARIVQPRPEGMSRRMFHQEIADDIVRTLNNMGYEDTEGWVVYKGDGKYELAIRVEGLQTFLSLNDKDETPDDPSMPPLCTASCGDKCVH